MISRVFWRRLGEAHYDPRIAQALVGPGIAGGYLTDLAVVTWRPDPLEAAVSRAPGPASCTDRTTTCGETRKRRYKFHLRGGEFDFLAYD